MEQTPLFRDPTTNREIKYEHAKKRLKEVLRAAGLAHLASGLHSLRIVGATAYANSPAGGYMVAGFMGCCTSDVKYAFMHAYSAVLEKAGISVAREEGHIFAQRPGAVQAYAGRRR